MKASPNNWHPTPGTRKRVRALAGRTMRNQATERPLTSDEVMDILGISKATFFKYVRENPDHFRTYMSGRWRVMDRQDLEHWREHRKQQDS